MYRGKIMTKTLDRTKDIFLDTMLLGKEILVKIDAQKASIRQLKALILRTEVSLQSIGSFRAIRTSYLV